MNFIALGFALPAALHNPWLHGAALVVLLVFLPRLLGIVYIPHTQVGIIEKIWSAKGSLREGQIVARNGEAGFQSRFLRGGIHFGLYPWQYRIHKEPLVVVSEGKMAYVYARDGVPLDPTQTLGHTVECNHYQDAVEFSKARPTRPSTRHFARRRLCHQPRALCRHQRRTVFSGPVKEADRYESWRQQLASMRAFDPVVIGRRCGQRHVRATFRKVAPAKRLAGRWPSRRRTSIRTSTPSAS